jgi:hypothetical protein
MHEVPASMFKNRWKRHRAIIAYPTHTEDGSIGTDAGPKLQPFDPEIGRMKRRAGHELC